MEIENLKKVVWRLEAFVSNLKINHEEKVYAICHEQQTDYEFVKVCHRAKQEVEQLALHDKRIILKTYWNNFKVIYDQLEYWQNHELHEEFKMNQVNIALIPIHEVVYDLNTYFRAFFESEEESLPTFTNVFKKEKIEHLGISENDFETQNKTMFAISKIKSKFRLNDGRIMNQNRTNKGTFDLQNENIYNVGNGKIVQVGTRTDYNSSFMIDLANLYVLDVKDYLQHHFDHSINKNQYLDYVKYAVPNSNMIKHEGIKQAARDWVESIKVQNIAEKQAPESIESTFVNNFDHVQPNKVREHFQKLVEWKELTEEELNSFLKQAFEERKLKGARFTLKRIKTTKNITSVFYDYYNRIAQRPHGKKIKYVELLGEYFEGFKTNTLKTNFSKSVY
jgi:hypothetical protein